MGELKVYLLFDVTGVADSVGTWVLGPPAQQEVTTPRGHRGGQLLGRDPAKRAPRC